MALVFCRDCGKQISERAPTCPGCGAPAGALAPAPAKRWKMKWFLRCVGLVMMFFIGLTVWGALMPVEKRDRYAGCRLARHFVQAKLRAPSTADFPRCASEFLAVRSGGDEWTAKGYVDAQNLFGVKIRSTYLVKMRHRLGSNAWLPIDISFNQDKRSPGTESRQSSPVGTKGI